MLPEQDALLRQVTLFQTNWFNALQQAKIDKTGGKAVELSELAFLEEAVEDDYGYSIWQRSGIEML